jgi:hypothetical protein
LIKQIAAEARDIFDAEGKVEFESFFKAVLLRVSQNAVSQLLGVGGAEGRQVLARFKFAVNANARWRVGGDVQI